MTSIGYLGRKLGLNCGVSAQELAFDLYDVGTAAGIEEGEAIYMDLTTLCLCTRVGCNSEFYEATYRRVKERVASLTSGEAEGRNMLAATNMLEGSRCADAVAGAELVRAGFQCAIAAGTTSATFKNRRIESIMRVEQVDRTTAESIADTCSHQQ